jgi:hypothetical protein
MIHLLDIGQAMLYNSYWIGKTIHEHQNAANWGTSVIEQLAMDFQNSFPGMKGFSSRNLWRMRDFYLSYHGNEKTDSNAGRN